jgi:hypothetical protein
MSDATTVAEYSEENVVQSGVNIVTIETQTARNRMQLLIRKMTGKIRLVRLALLAGSAVLLLSGCIKIDMKIALDSKALASGTFKLEITKEAASAFGITNAQMFEDMVEQSGDSPLPAGSSISTKETDTGYEETFTFVDMPLTDLENGLGKAEVLADGRIKFSIKQDAPSGSASEVTGGSMNFEISFPGKIVEASPAFTQVDDDTVSLSGTGQEAFDLFVISEASGAGSGSSFPTVPIVIILAVLALIGYWIIGSRFLARQEAQTAPTEPGTSME